MLVPLLLLFQTASKPASLEVTAAGLKRTALVCAPAEPSSGPVPLVFVWHGFTGNAAHAAFAYHVHKSLPNAVTVYPQGLNVKLLGKEAPGWQILDGTQGDRDLKFFDELLKTLSQTYRVDSHRIYTCGMSNGAIFSYLLMKTRGDKLAAAAPVAGYSPVLKGGTPLPVMIIHGKDDPLIPVRAAERSLEWALRTNGAAQKASEWMPGYDLHAGPKGNDVVWRLHSGGHDWPAGTADVIAKFFQQHRRP